MQMLALGFVFGSIFGILVGRLMKACCMDVFSRVPSASVSAPNTLIASMKQGLSVTPGLKRARYISAACSSASGAKCEAKA